MRGFYKRAHATLTILYVRSGADAGNLYLDELPTWFRMVYSNVFALLDSLATFVFLLS
jgi:hypothetical protein